MDTDHSEGQGQLIKEVINRGICVTCGACVGLCPYFQYFDGKVVTLDQCRSDTWRCLQVCPRADFEGTALDGFLSDNGESLPVGAYQKIVIARSSSTEIRERAQYGGVVSVLLIHALEQGLVTSAILTDRGHGISPSGRIVRDRQAVIDCAGSRYSASGSLAALNAARVFSG